MALATAAAAAAGRCLRGRESVVRMGASRTFSAAVGDEGEPQIGELLENPIKLYRDCLRLADYLGKSQGNADTLKKHIQSTFRKNMHETDPAAISSMKEAAVRGLSNYMLFEAQRMAQKGAYFDKDEKDG